MMDGGGVGGDGVDGWDRRWRLLVDELLFELVRREERCRARVVVVPLYSERRAANCACAMFGFGRQAKGKNSRR